MITKHCNTCGFADPMQHVCQLNNRKIDLDIDFCSSHNSNPTVCEICGRITLEPILLEHKDGYITSCGECRQRFNSCLFCEHGSICAFEADTTMPKVVQKQIRQGPMVSVIQVKNPDLIAKTCQSGCSCFDTENGCMRDFNYCERMKHKYD